MTTPPSHQPLILVIDDEPPIRRFLRAALTNHNYRWLEAENGQSGLDLILNRQPDLAILDLGLPDMDGLEVLRRVREWSPMPIVVLSARGQEQDKVAALDLGADDYLTKPFGLSELLARLRAHLRRSQQGSDEPQIRSGDLLIDLASRSITLKGEPVTLTPTEYDILRVLARHAGRVMMHQKLMREVWGHGLQDLHTLRVNISNIRKKIESNPARPQILLTEPGVGYRFVVHEAGA